MVPLNIQTTIEDQIAALITDLAVVQPAYFSLYGRYWQGKRTHITPPADGTKTRADLDTTPTDQSETWKHMGINLPTDTEASYSVSVYHTRAGHGYIIHADVLISGIHHRKSVNVGPDTSRTHTWQTFKIIPMS